MLRITEKINEARFDSLKAGDFCLYCGYLCFIGETSSGLLPFDIMDGKFLQIDCAATVEPVRDVELLVPFSTEKLRNR